MFRFSTDSKNLTLSLARARKVANQLRTRTGVRGRRCLGVIIKSLTNFPLSFGGIRCSRPIDRCVFCSVTLHRTNACVPSPPPSRSRYAKRDNAFANEIFSRLARANFPIFRSRTDQRRPRGVRRLLGIASSLDLVYRSTCRFLLSIGAAYDKSSIRGRAVHIPGIPGTYRQKLIDPLTVTPFLLACVINRTGIETLNFFAENFRCLQIRYEKNLVRIRVEYLDSMSLDEDDRIDATIVKE